MKWISIKTVSKNELYELWDNTKKILSLVFNANLNTVRIENPENKRMFMIEKEGFLRSKTILKNEYGVKVGEFGPERLKSENGFIELNNERYYYSIQQQKAPEVVLYKNGENQPLLTYSIGDPASNASSSPNQKGNKYAYVLMALCSYLFSPLQPNKVELVA